ncbi:MAG: S-layer homology domain-containing protein [Clostridiales bacterium]|nr:S-layer homology domain-containing protein [Clostridiales bacterium]
MKNPINSYISLFLIVALTLLCVTMIAFAQDITVLSKNGFEGIAPQDGYNIKELQLTRFPDLKQTAENTLKIWGGPYLTANDQICFSFVNDTDSNIGLTFLFNLEAEINGNWYELTPYWQESLPPITIPPGKNLIYGVREDVKPKLYPGKHRIVYNGMHIGEFEIVETGSSLPNRPQNYDLLFLLSPLLFRVNDDKEGLRIGIVEQDGLDIIRVEWQPITTDKRSIEFLIDLDNIDEAYWYNLYLETKIDDQWYTLAWYRPDRYDKSKYTVTYHWYYWDEFATDTTLNKIMLTNIWAPAGPFPGTHRIWGDLRLKDWSSVIAYGEFEIIEATDNIQPKPSEWAKETVKAAIASNLVPQNLQINYQQPINRAEFAALTMFYLESVTELSTAELLSQKNLAFDKNIFHDTNDELVLAASALGIVKGLGNNTFDPYGKITREQLATMLMRAQAVLRENVAISKVADYSDRDSFSSWANQSIDYVTEKGVMNGIGDNRFDPKGSCSREQAIVTFYRMRYAF